MIKKALVGDNKSGMFHIDKALAAMTAAAPAPGASTKA
jgi:hypothetical protein